MQLLISVHLTGYHVTFHLFWSVGFFFCKEASECKAAAAAVTLGGKKNETREGLLIPTPDLSVLWIWWHRRGGETAVWWAQPAVCICKKARQSAMVHFSWPRLNVFVAFTHKKRFVRVYDVKSASQTSISSLSQSPPLGSWEWPKPNFTLRLSVNLNCLYQTCLFSFLFI